MPDEPPLSGFVFASAISSFTDFAATDGCTHEDVGRVRRARHREQVLERVERQLAVEARVDREARWCPAAPCSRRVRLSRRCPRRCCPSAPGRLSTMTCCPRSSVSLWLSARAVVSVPPPGREADDAGAPAWSGYAAPPRRPDCARRRQAGAQRASLQGFHAVSPRGMFRYRPVMTSATVTWFARCAHAARGEPRRERERVLHRAGIGLALADDVVGRAVRGRREHRLQARRSR